MKKKTSETIEKIARALNKELQYQGFLRKGKLSSPMFTKKKKGK